MIAFFYSIHFFVLEKIKQRNEAVFDEVCKKISVLGFWSDQDSCEKDSIHENLIRLRFCLNQEQMRFVFWCCWLKNRPTTTYSISYLLGRELFGSEVEIINLLNDPCVGFTYSYVPN